MKLGLISDIHGDPVALELAWSHLTLMGADSIICVGDLVGYGPFPDRVVTFLQERQVPAVRGNHDRWAIERGPGGRDEFGGATPSTATLDHLRSLPFEHVVDASPKIGVVVHGSPRSDMEFVQRRRHGRKALRNYLLELKCDFLVVGHTHQPMCFACADGLVINPGSVVSMPVVDSSRTYAMFDLNTHDVIFCDVESGQRVKVEVWS
jgi:putative phosphoesterase